MKCNKIICYTQKTPLGIKWPGGVFYAIILFIALVEQSGTFYEAH